LTWAVENVFYTAVLIENGGFTTLIRRPMRNSDAFPKVDQYYFTRRGKFKVLAIKGKMVTIEWQDNRDKLTIEISEIKKMLISEKYSGDPERFAQNDDKAIRYKKSSDDDAEETEES
jgi:hypothetical protein